MNRINASKIKSLTKEGKKLLDIAATLEKMAANRAGTYMVLQGQSEGLKEAATYVRSQIGK